jgi:hypothetical protein
VPFVVDGPHTSLPGASRCASRSRTRSGSITLAGVRYFVRSFSRKALGGEPVSIWILERT